MFKKLTGVEKKKIFKTLRVDHRTWYLKSRTNEIFRAELKRIMADKVLVLESLEKNSPKKSGTFVVNFTFKEQKYFFMARANFTKDGVFVDLPEEMYMLQRRKSERVPVVAGGGIKCKIKSHRFNNLELPVQVMEFGPSGCKLTYGYATPHMIKDASVRLEFKLGSKVTAEVDGFIRHSKTIEEKVANKVKTQQTFGIEFKNVGASLQTRILVLFMELQKKALEHYDELSGEF